MEEEKPLKRSSKKSKKLLAKKDFKYSKPGFKFSLKKGDDCSAFKGNFKKLLKENGII